MGMAASQARLLNLQARQSNLEYQGQQINQERTILSQQCTALYNSLLAMEVPTPPSTQDFTTVQYTGTDGASNFTLGSIIPTGDTYTVEMKYKKTGHYLEEKGSASVVEVPQFITMDKVTVTTPTTKKETKCPDSVIGEGKIAESGKNVMSRKTENLNASGAQLYELKDGKFVAYTKPAGSSTIPDNVYALVTANNTTSGSSTTASNYDPKTDYQVDAPQDVTTGGLRASDLDNLYVDNGDGNAATKITEANIGTYFEETSTDSGVYKLKTSASSKTFFHRGEKATSDNDNTALNPDFKNYEYYVADQPCMTLTQAVSEGRISSTSKDSYIQAIKDAYPEYAESDISDIENNFKVYFTKGDSGLYVPHFVSTADLQSGTIAANGNKFVTSYDYTANGTYTSAVKETECQLTFDTAGRITEIKIPTARKADGTPTTRKTISLEASTVTDDAAYKDAYNKFEYAQYEYDKKQQEINAKTSIIQQEDRNLELKLQRLDNERTQIKTEIDAVDKVISENIEKSYKTFSG